MARSKRKKPLDPVAAVRNLTAEQRARLIIGTALPLRAAGDFERARASAESILDAETVEGIREYAKTAEGRIFVSPLAVTQNDTARLMLWSLTHVCGVDQAALARALGITPARLNQFVKRSDVMGDKYRRKLLELVKLALFEWRRACEGQGNDRTTRVIQVRVASILSAVVAAAEHDTQEATA